MNIPLLRSKLHPTPYALPCTRTLHQQQAAEPSDIHHITSLAGKHMPRLKFKVG